MRAEGYHVLEAANAGEALSILQSAEPIDVVITDRQMPGQLDGVALAQQIRDGYDVAGVIMVSGQAPDSEASGLVDAYLRKPCPSPRLITHIRALAPDED